MTTKARATKKQVQGMLLEGNFAEHTDTPLTLSDPLTVTQMILKLSEIKAYDKNPRKEKNPLYDEIKASVLSNKRLNNNFNITRRPGDNLFMVESGGNTRLQILNELYNETGDEAFNQVQCLFVPWSSESTILTSHLIENEIRGDMILIDKAYAVKSLKEEMEIELGKTLNRNEFSKLVAERGYKVSRRNLIRFDYAIELDQMIPQVLRANISTRKIDEIKKIYQSYCDYCSNKTDRFELIFMGVMSEHDNEEFNIKDVRTDLGVQLAAEIEVQSNHIFLEIQSRIVNSTAGQNSSDAFGSLAQHTTSTEGQSTQQSEVIAPDNTASMPSTSSQESNAGDYANKTHSAATKQHPENLAENLATNNQQSTPSPSSKDNSTQLTLDSEGEINLASLRNRNYELICHFARPYQLETVIHPLDTGLGFFIECPEQAFDFDDPNERTVFKLKIKYLIWWFMFGLAEQNLDVLRFHTWKHTELFKLFHEQERGTDSLSKRVNNSPELRLFLALFLQCTETLSDKGFVHVFRLMENIRKIKKHYPNEQIWEHQE